MGDGRLGHVGGRFIRIVEQAQDRSQQVVGVAVGGRTSMHDVDLAWFGGREYVGADAAFDAINPDWGFWCHEGTLAAVEAGTFNKTAAWVSYTSFSALSSRADDIYAPTVRREPSSRIVPTP